MNPEIFSDGLVIMVMGICVVFFVLIIISLVLSLFNIIFGKNSTKAAQEAEKAEMTAITSAPAVEEVNLASDDELVAVITAAIAMSMESEGISAPQGGFVVRSIKKATLWNKETIREQQNLNLL